MTSPTDRIRRTVLPNGLRVVTDEQPERSMVSVAVWVAVGSRDEPDAVGGASHFLEHLLFKGTEHRDARSIALAIDRIGGDMNAFTAGEHTAFYLGVPVDEAHIAVDLLLDVLDRPSLAARDVDSERQVILEELAAAQDDPDDLASVSLFEGLYPGHPLGRETLGTAESISGMGQGAVQSFFERWYRPSNLVVAAAGAIDHDLLVEEVETRFGSREPGEAPVRTAPSREILAEVFRGRAGDVSHLAMGWRAPSATVEDRYPAALLNHVFGGGPSSLLFQEIREARGLTYSVGSELAQHVDTGALTVHCSTTSDGAAVLVELVDAIASDLAEHGLDREALARAKGAMRGAMVMGLENPVARMTRLGVGETMRGQVMPASEHLERIESVSLDDVKRVAHEIFGAPRTLSVVGPERIQL